MKNKRITAKAIFLLAVATIVIGCKKEKETILTTDKHPDITSRIQGTWIAPFKGDFDTATCSIIITFTGNTLSVKNTSLTPTNFDYMDNFVILNDTIISMGEGCCHHLPYRYSLSNSRLTLGNFGFVKSLQSRLSSSEHKFR